jgi:cobalt-zinc-cadmium efflux system protein
MSRQGDDQPAKGSRDIPDETQGYPHGHADHDHAVHDHTDRGHAGHTHGAHVDAGNERRVFWAAVLTGGFMLIEVAGGLIAGSLALLADAGHMLTDSAALALAWLAFRIARRPADWQRTYGFDRFQVLAAFVNGLALFIVAGWVIVEAFERFLAPVPVLAGPMLAVAVAGLAINVVTFLVLHGADRGNLNVRSALLHVVGDLLGSAGAIAAAGIILSTGWTPIDPILSILVSVLILRSAWRIVRESGYILLEAAPTNLDIREIEADLNDNVAEIERVHHVHAWSLTQNRPLVTLHVKARADAAPGSVAGAVKRRLRERFGVDHATIEVEHGDGSRLAPGEASSCHGPSRD